MRHPELELPSCKCDKQTKFSFLRRSQFAFYWRVITALVFGFSIGQTVWAEDVSLSGSYNVVDLRRDPTVAGPPNDPSLSVEIGDEIDFNNAKTLWDGEQCDDWRTEPNPDVTIDVFETILSDTQIPPIDGTASKGDRRLNLGLWMLCDGIRVSEVVKIDERVAVAQSASAGTYIILERPLSSQDVKAFQTELKSMKFLETSPSEEWTKKSQSALGAYADYRGADYQFARAAITENLLDGLLLSANSGRPGVLKIIHAGGIAAYFYGEELELQPRVFGTASLAFRFEGDDREYVFEPEGELFFSDWTFDIFSPDGEIVMLKQDRFGPYHLVQRTELKRYLAGEDATFRVVGGTPEGGEASVHSDEVWMPDGSLSYKTSCCGDTVDQLWRAD